MRTHDEELAYKILMRNGEWGMTGCLEHAKAQVALRGQNVLDDFSQLHLRLLSLMCTGLTCNQSSIGIYFDSDLASMSGQLDDLDVAGYIEWNGVEYVASATGKNVTRQIGIEMLGMDIFRMTGDLETSKALLKTLRP